ncbi:MAG TPA: hypothetical protein PKA00_08515 [Saprospiraceae bacterium]|nr:hypothetical protein [Saprospiraceae bacterium]HMQ82937.1 hypothetical protein [Saprospiraceae bacterium]
MTRDQFFRNITSLGVLPTLQLLAGQNPDAELQMKRLENLSKDLKLGLVTLADAAITRNRIAMAILSLLEDDKVNENEEADTHVKLSEILRDHLRIAESDESFSKEQARANFDAISLNREKYYQELPEPDMSPVPKSELATIAGIREMIASGELEQALVHSLTLTQGSDLYKSTTILSERYKQLFLAKKRQLISYEEAASEQHRIAEALIHLLRSFEEASDRNENSFWGSIKKWFNLL